MSKYEIDIYVRMIASTAHDMQEKQISKFESADADFNSVFKLGRIDGGVGGCTNCVRG